MKLRKFSSLYDLISLFHFVIVYLFIHVPELLFESSQKWNNQQCVKIRKYWREIDLMCSNSAYKKDKTMYSVYTKCLCWDLGWILYMQYITRRHESYGIKRNKSKNHDAQISVIPKNVYTNTCILKWLHTKH